MDLRNQEINQGKINLISDTDFILIRDLIYEKVGINLTIEKKALVTGRLLKVLRENHFSSFSDYYNFVLNDKSGQALSNLVDKISTNHTFFGREFDHFNHFKQVAFPELVARKNKEKSRDIRIWSAGCSTGEEPYTLVILMKEYLGDSYKQWDAGVLATDISTVALGKAINGVYENTKLHNFDAKLRDKYFKQVGDKWAVKDDIKKEVTFKRFNLMNDFFPFKQEFDIIFCRNVMIYFDADTRVNLINKFYNNLVNTGYFYIGHSETIDRKKSDFKYIMPAAYKKVI